MNEVKRKTPVNICNRCSGRGYTKAEAPVMGKKTVGKRTVPFTKALGSGCEACLGTGKKNRQ